MGAVKDRIQLDLDEVKAYLGIENDDSDVLLELLMSSALDYVDEFLNNPFTHEEDGVEIEDDIPDAIKVAVLQLISTMYKVQSQSGPANSGPVIQQEVGDVSVKYGQSRMGTPSELSDWLSSPLLVNILWQYRMIPGI